MSIPSPLRGAFKGLYLLPFQFFLDEMCDLMPNDEGEAKSIKLSLCMWSKGEYRYSRIPLCCHSKSVHRLHVHLHIFALVYIIFLHKSTFYSPMRETFFVDEAKTKCPSG